MRIFARYAVLPLALIASGCDDTVINEAAPPILPGVCTPAPVPSAQVRDILPGDGLGNVLATDFTEGANRWVWTLPGCSPERSTSSSFPSLCPIGVLNWSLTVGNGTCEVPHGGSTPVS